MNHLKKATMILSIIINFSYRNLQSFIFQAYIIMHYLYLAKSITGEKNKIKFNYSVPAHTNEPKTAKELSDWNNFCDAFLCTACMMFYFYRLARFTRSTKICAPALTPVLPY